MDGHALMTEMESFVPGPDTARAFRSALGQFATGVTVITAQGKSGPVGITANSFASVSLDPALVMWCPARTSTRFDTFSVCDSFAIHVLGEDQREMGNAFVKSGGAFDCCDWSAAEDGTPLINDVLARFHCKTYAQHDGGDHVIVVGQVLTAATRPGAPLVFSSGQYGQFKAG